MGISALRWTEFYQNRKNPLREIQRFPNLGHNLCENDNETFHDYVSVKSKLQHPPGQPPGHLTFLKIIVQIPPYPGQNAVQMPHTRDHSGDQMPPPRGHFTISSPWTLSLARIAFNTPTIFFLEYTLRIYSFQLAENVTWWEPLYFLILNYHISVSIRKSAKRGHCTRAEQERCIMTD